MKFYNDNLNRSDIFLQYHDYVRFIAMLNAPSRDLIGDIVNDTFVAFLEWENDESIQNARSLLRQITVNISKRYWRKKLDTMPQGMARIAEYIQIRTQNRENPEQMEDIQDKLVAIDHCLQNLPEKCRKLLHDHYMDGRSIVEIAKESNHKAEVLYNTISRARASLGRCVDSFLGRNGHDQ